MANLSGIVQVLKDERDRVEKQLSALNAALTAFVGVYGGKTSAIGTANGKRGVSAAARRKMSLAQKARWAKVASNGQPSAKPKRVMSASARRKIAAAQRARWAKIKKLKSAEVMRGQTVDFRRLN
jgi:hypothetical protein